MINNREYDLTYHEYQHRPTPVLVVEYDGTPEQEKALVRDFPKLFSFARDYEEKKHFYCRAPHAKQPEPGDRIIFDASRPFGAPVLVMIASKPVFYSLYEPCEVSQDASYT